MLDRFVVVMSGCIMVGDRIDRLGREGVEWRGRDWGKRVGSS